MDSTAFDVIKRLGDLLTVQVNSSTELSAGVEKAASAVDRERAKKKTSNEGHGPRKPGLRQLPPGRAWSPMGDSMGCARDIRARYGVGAARTRQGTG